MSGTQEPVRILHVDDEPDFAEMVATFLEREDDRFAVETATSAREGRARLDGSDVDCIVSDYEMPDESGIEFLEAVREDHPDLPFVLFTGQGSEEIASEAISAGVTDYLQKGSGTDQYALLANRITNAVERYRIEREADQTRTQLQAVLENSADAIVTIDSESRIRLANATVEDYFGYTPAELRGESLTTIMPRQSQEGHLEAIERYVRTGERTMEWSNVELTGQHKDGTEIPLSISFGEFEQEGERRFVGIMRDISERVRMEEELREREQRFRQLTENLQDVVWMSDPDREELLYVNPTYEDVWGRPVETLYDDPGTLLEAVHPEDRDRVEAALDALAAGEYEEEYRIVRPDGELRWIRDRAVPVTDDDGEVSRIVGIASDITERTRQTRRLETLISNLPGIVYRCRNAPGWPMEYVRGECEAITGYSAGALEDDEVVWGEDVLHPEDRERIWEEVQEELAADGEFEVTYRIRTVHGTVRWMWERGQLVESGPEGDEVLEGFITDITERRRRQERLQRTTARLEAVFENSPDMINVHDAEGNIIDPNPRLCEETGYGADELAGMKVWELDEAIGPDEAHELWDGMEAGDRRRVDGEFRRRDGSTFPVEVHVRRLDLDGEPRFVVISRNVSEREARERELERYEAIVENTEDGIYVFDADGNFEFVNGRVVDVSGIPRDAWIGEHVSIHTELGTLTEGEVVAIEEAIGAIVQGDADEVSVELAPDISHDLRVLELRLTPFSAGSGDDRVIGFSRDITERKRNERTLRELQGRTEELIRSSTREEVSEVAVATARDVLGFRLSGIHLVDDDRERLDPIAVTDEVREHLGEAPTYDRTNPSRSTDTINWEIFERGETVVIEDTHEHEWIAASETPSRSGIIQPLGDHGLFIVSSPDPGAFDDADVAFTEILATVVTAVLDRTERETTLRNRTRRLEAQKERLDEFAGIVSHDLRNPLNVATGRLELAREECDSEHLAVVERAHERMRTLVDDLLTLARHGTPVEEIEPVELGALTEACWQNVETAEATLVAETDGTVRADRSRLQQLLENLMANAVDHGGPGVTVRIGDLADGSGFYVADDGPGIPADRREQVFESGYSTSESGTGFGLAIVREIADAHGWDVRVTESDDGGARFEISGVATADT